MRKKQTNTNCSNKSGVEGAAKGRHADSSKDTPLKRAYRAAYEIPPLDPEIKKWTTPPTTEPELSQWLKYIQTIQGSESLRAKLTERHTNITEAIGKAYDTVIPDTETALLEANLNPFRRNPTGSLTTQRIQLEKEQVLQKLQYRAQTEARKLRAADIKALCKLHNCHSKKLPAHVLPKRTSKGARTATLQRAKRFFLF